MQISLIVVVQQQLCGRHKPTTHLGQYGGMPLEKFRLTETISEEF